LMSINGPGFCGYYGKVPARADFVGSRLRRETIERWDQWLQEALAESQRQIGSRWHDRFFMAPIWRFILPSGACGRFGLMGILMSSVDAVGRCFPLMLGHEIDGHINPLALLAGSGRWFAAAEELALAALGDGFDLDHFNRVLPNCQALPHPNDYGASALAPSECMRGEIGTWMSLPLASARTTMAAAALMAGSPGRAEAWPSIWWTVGAEAAPGGGNPMPGLAPGLAVSHGLVPPRGFAAFLDGCWADHGWTVRAAARSEAPDPGSSNQAGGETGDWERRA